MEYTGVIQTLIETYHPLKIYLYGSRAWGNPQADSDVDIFILLTSSDIDQADRIRLGARALIGSGIDVDLLVLTEAEIMENKSHPSTLVYKILEKGIKIYEAA